jgi:serine/threonine protein kinase
MKHLKKTAGARLHNVQTYSTHCNSSGLSAQLSLKTGDEADEFVHVMKGKMNEVKDPIVIKAHEHGSLFVKRELQALKILSEWPQAVQYICDFSCIDDTERWMKPIKNNAHLCQPSGKSHIHFIVLEYIDNGDLATHLSKIKDFKELKALFIHIALTIAYLGYQYRIYHGDLNSGNILIDQTDKKYTEYTINDTMYRARTYGRLPKLIDFGRGGKYEGKIHFSFIKDDILTMFSVMTSYIDSAFKETFVNCINSLDKARDLTAFITQMKEHWPNEGRLHSK